MAKQARSIRLAQGRLGGGGGAEDGDEFNEVGGSDKKDTEMEVVGISSTYPVYL